MGYNFVIQPFHDFRKWENEGYRTRDAHFFEHIRQRDDVDKVIIINRPLSLAERILKRKDKKYSKGEVILTSKKFEITKLDSKTYIFDFYPSDFLSVIIQKRKWWDTSLRNLELQKNIVKGIKYLKIHDYVLLIQNPMAIGLSEGLQPETLVFDTIDNWLEHEQMKDIKPILEQNYHEIDVKSDLIISVSENNRKLFPNNNNFYEIPNGVDFDRFDINIESTDKNIIGYVGKIQDRFDFDLLEILASSHKNCEFRIYGPIYSGKKEAERLSSNNENIHFLGNVSYDELPMLLNELSIGIIPHKVNEFTQSMNPLKAYEYLAAGIPVVSTGVNGVSQLSTYLRIGSNKEEFTLEFDKLLLQVSTINKEDIRKSMDRGVSWSEKVNKLFSLIEEKNNNV
ncbi:glycosyltransferase [Lactococcus lactis]|uniref:glycosyltransferase n=1 Tax=Lactococcus lactis TaxID=1358 RepID=UPI0032E4F281